MNTATDTKTRMTVEAFLAWCEARQRDWSGTDAKDWELFDGVPVMQQSERWLHAETKMALYRAFDQQVRQAQLPFEVAIDSIGVKTSERDYVEPDIVIFPAGLIGPDDLLAPEPVLVAEVLSPSTAKVDLTTKLAGYNRVLTIAHYLVLDPDAGALLHYTRVAGVLTPPNAPANGELRLAPPGLTLRVDDCFKR